jgi:hypothetical protein
VPTGLGALVADAVGVGAAYLTERVRCNQPEPHPCPAATLDRCPFGYS